jgi:ribokinase
MSRQPRIAVVGSANVDLVTFTDRFPAPGETIFGQDFDMGFGGKGANQAVAARLCGAQVSMVARLGADLFGPPTIKNFQDLGIDTSQVQLLEGVSSGVAPIFVDPHGQNRILVVKGANDRLTPADVDRAAPLLKQADCIILQFEIPIETVYYTIRFARANGIKCILNPAPGQPVDLDEVARVDYFIPNESEAETIAGKPVKTVEQARECARYFLARGIPRVIITLGVNGALLAANGTLELIPAYTVTTKDTTGAGDAFIGSFATFLAEGVPERQAVAQACLYASLSTTKVGTQKSFLPRAEFEAQRESAKPRPSTL